MSPEEIKLVQSTFQKVVPIAEDAAAMFYARLFELNPKLKALFKGEMVGQGKKLMAMLATAVNGLDKLDEIVPAVRNLGVRHIDYGVKAQDYDTVGEALLWTLGQGLGDAFTPEVKSAWTEAYVLLATTMKDAAKEAA
ncbi:MAG: hemin receptor [Rhodospirillaceae bacterium]|nr:MAG: hemin receptor [Rhodospirillaceae bacterium]